jgi:hypothetical protein
MMWTKINKLWIGAIVGLLVPWIAFYIYYLYALNSFSFEETVKMTYRGNLLMKYISLAAIANLGFFYWSLNKSAYRFGYGIILSMFIYAFVVMIQKFVLE